MWSRAFIHINTSSLSLSPVNTHDMLWTHFSFLSFYSSFGLNKPEMVFFTCFELKILTKFYEITLEIQSLINKTNIVRSNENQKKIAEFVYI